MEQFTANSTFYSDFNYIVEHKRRLGLISKETSDAIKQIEQETRDRRKKEGIKK